MKPKGLLRTSGKVRVIPAQAGIQSPYPLCPLPLAKDVVSKVSISVTLSEAKGLGVVGFVRAMPGLTPRFFVTSLLRMTFDTKPLPRGRGLKEKRG